jgi:hypothetical protein
MELTVRVFSIFIHAIFLLFSCKTAEIGRENHLEDGFTDLAQMEVGKKTFEAISPTAIRKIYFV